MGCKFIKITLLGVQIPKVGRYKYYSTQIQQQKIALKGAGYSYITPRLTQPALCQQTPVTLYLPIPAIYTKFCYRQWKLDRYQPLDNRSATVGSVSGVGLVTETDRGRFVLMTGQRVSAPPSVSDEDSLGAEWSMEQPWHQLSSPLLISNLAPLETRVLNQSTNGLHLSLS